MYRHTILYSLLFLLTIAVNGQVKITGTVVEGATDQSLIGVTIYEKDQPNATVTDVSGNYEITVKSPESILIFSYIGYATQEQLIGERNNVSVVMEEDIARLDEVVVVGYSTQKKSVVTSAISSVNAEDLEDMPVGRIEQTLQGRTSGVRVTANSGQPGDGGTVRIRGTSSIGSGSEPLYVVDGVVIGGGIEYLNQGDIESIEVLKDASASIYGARAAAGVILVTTKKGQEGKMKVNYNNYFGVQNPARKLALLNATEYAILMNESLAAAKEEIRYPDPQSLGEGTDWQDAVFRENAPMQNHDINLSAGNEKSNYYISFSLFNQDGIVSQDRSNYKRFTTRFNSNHKINKYVNFGNNVAYSRDKRIGVSTNSEFGSPLGRAINIDPITPIIETDPEVLSTNNSFDNANIVKNEAGDPYGITPVGSEIVNPLAALSVESGHGWSDKVVGNAFIEVSPFVEGLKLRSDIGTDLAFWGDEGFSPIFYITPTNKNDTTSYSRGQNRGLRYIWTNTISYDRDFGKHSLNVVAGTVADENKGQGIGGSVLGIPVDNIEDASFAYSTPKETQGFGGYEYINRTFSYIGRLDYNYNQKYLLGFTFRADGSTKFGDRNKYGYFPGVSVGWVLTEEGFLYKHPAINFFKLRGSWGVTGNDQIADFLYTTTVGGGRNYTFGAGEVLTNGFSLNALANPDLRWEETVQTNIGFDAKLFKRVSLTVDVFNKAIDGMLLGIEVPGYIGNGGPTGNIASMTNKGIEFEVGYGNTFGQFGFDFSGNLSYVENEVTSLGADKEFIPGQRFSPQGLEITRITEGLPIGYLFGHETDGIFQNQAEIDAYTNPDGDLIQPDAAPGDFKFKDIDGDGVLTEDDRTMIGDPTPSWTYGLNLGLDWKGIDVSIFGQGVWGNEIFKATRRFDLEQANMTADALDRWTGEGTSTKYPRLINGDPNKNFSRSSDFYVENGAFFKIKTAQLGYTLNNNLVKQIGVSRIRLYVSGNNLITFTKYTGFDPEIGGGSYGVDRGLYPQARFFLFGLNATFQ